MFRLYIGKIPNTLTDTDLMLLAEKTEGWVAKNASVTVDFLNSKGFKDLTLCDSMIML